MTALPPPADPGAPVARLVAELDGLLGRPRFVAVCVDLLGGADRRAHLAELPWLTGLDWSPGSPALDGGHWKDYWLRTWGARGLLHVWDDAATPAVVAGLGDAHWRPAEMCLKVATAHEVAGTADGAAALADHPLPRVRAQSARTLGALGDTEHVASVRALLDDPTADVRRAAARALDVLVARLDLGPGAGV